METNNIQTRKDEIRFFTNKPEEMLGKYLAKRLLRTWQEDFVDNDTGEVVSIDRNEIIADRGQLITRLRFSPLLESVHSSGLK